MNTIKLTVIDKIKETDEVCSFVLRPSDNSTIEYKSGQYLPIKIPHESGVLFRSYSLSSVPNVNEDLKITVKREKGGKGSNWVCDNLHIGDSLDTLAPAGVFYPNSWQNSFVFFAGGSGITPIISIIKTALLKDKNNKIKLFYANSSSQSIIFEDELIDLSLIYPDRLSIHFWMDDERGVPTETAFTDHLESDASTQYFLCGPAPFMTGVEEFLKKSKVSIEAITKESFVSNVPDVSESNATNKEKDISVTVVLNGVKTEVMCSEDDFILNEIIRQGLNVPNSCGAGNCGSCMCSLIEGEVHLESNTVLDISDEEEGWILACRSKPRSKSLEISFDQ